MGANQSKLVAFFEETTDPQMPPTVYRIPKFLELWPMPRNPVSGADSVKIPTMEGYTMIFLPVAPAPKEKAPHEWTAQIVETGGGEGMSTEQSAKGAIITVEITTSSKSYFGEWYLQIDTNLLEDKKRALNYKMKKPFMLLFNPWNPKDTVYMQDEKMRQELVLRDEGILFCGIHKKMDKKPWTYDQYCPGVIECCNLMMTSDQISVRDRNDPVKISRLLAALVNAQDDTGIMEGCWDGNYKDGISPNAWISSAKIIQKYIETGKSVKFAQCWVFGGLITTLARAMGIPTRTVTCYNSGHDSDSTLTIDNFIDEMAETLKNMTEDTTWNYHVWNEMWMTRPDIEAETGEQIYGGWQAIDGTPQETSGGVYRVGPCSVAAVKMGEVKRPYDVPYVLSEVNADYVSIGKSIVTQKLGSYEREDIITNYKVLGSNKEERNIMNWAWKRMGDVFPRFEKNKESAEMKFSLDPAKDVMLGETLSIRIRTNNKSKHNELKVKVVLTLESVTYTNKYLGKIKQDVYNHVVGKNADQILMEVPYHEYAKMDKEQGYMRANMLASVPELKLDYFLKQSFRVRAPDIQVTTHGERVKGKPLQVTTTFKNTLPKFISKAYIVLHGSGVGEGQKHLFRNGAKPGEELSHTFKVIPVRSGDILLNAKLWSPEMKFAEGYLNVTIK
ncbi:annulin-like [Uloborus diversus]|uniref:annulin-like n=1 Tax=Uloborus diversus TaxID=327109 RepID=UPI0024095E74|nr:annulin-like [Uloborus diversus]